MATYDLTQGIPAKIVTGDILNVPYSGRAISMTLPKGTYKLEVWGSAGTPMPGPIGAPGKGGYSVGTLTLSASTLAYFLAGGTNGFNGADGEPKVGYFGGGGSDVRLLANSYYNRVIVAGGGGVGGGYAGATSGVYPGGYAGGLVGGNGTVGGVNYTTGGTQTAGGSGVGASFGTAAYGGGAGWYGGGGGAIGGTQTPIGAVSYKWPSAGGSGFALTSSTVGNTPSGYALGSSYYLTGTSVKGGNESITEPSGSAATGHAGDGYVRITAVSVATKLPTPTNLTATYDGSKVTLNWSAVQGATYYLVKYGQQSMSVQTTTAGWVISSPGTYTFTVDARNQSGNEPSDPASVSITILETLAKPSGLSYSGLSKNSVKISWNAVSHATSYAVYRGGTLKATVTTASYTDSSISPGTSYSYTVVSKASGYYDSPSSDALTVVNPSVLATPNAPYNAGYSETSIQLAWAAVSHATSYTVYRDGQAIGNPSTTSFTDNGISAGKTYNYTIVAKASGYYDSNSSAAYQFSNKPKLATPTGLSFPSKTETTIKITWYAVTNATSYAVYRDGTIVGTVSKAEYTDTNVSPGQTYAYKVIAKASGYYDSNASATYAVTNPEKLSTPGGITSSSTAAGSVTVSWNAVTHATTYYIKIDSGSWQTQSGTSKTFTGLASGSHTVQIYAGASGYYNSETATASVSVKPQLSPTANVTATIAENSVSLSWSAVTNATSYKVSRNGTLIATVNTPGYTDTTTKPGNTYSYSIVASDGSSYFDSNPATKSVTVAPKLDTPTGLYSPSRTETTAKIAWGAVTGATSYVVYRNGTIVGTVAKAEYNDNSILPGTSYNYAVIAKASGYYDSAQSAVFTLTNNPKLAAPANLTQTAQTVDSVTVSWSAVQNATNYYVSIDGGSYQSQTATSKTFGNLAAGSHTVRVYATANGYYNSNISNLTATVNPRVETPSFGELSQTQTSTTLAWSAVQNAASYSLERDGTVIYSGTLLTYNDTGLTTKSTHTYTLTAVASTGYYNSIPVSLTLRIGRDLTQIDKQKDYMEMLRKPFVKLCRLRFLNPNGTTAFALDNNPNNPRSKAFIAQGSISANWQNGQRYTASVTLNNVDGEYDFAVNKLWFGQEIAIDEGLVLSTGEEYYRQSGVFIIDNPQESMQPVGKTVTYNLVDKWANLDGTLGGNLEGTYEVPVGTNIFNPVASLLSEDRGNGKPIDRVSPVFTEFYNDKTQELPDGTTVDMTDSPYTLTVDGDSGTMAQVILGLAGMVNAWVGYDVTGALRIDPSQDDILDSSKPILWRFSPEETQLLGATYTVKKEDVFNDYIIVGEQLDDYSQPGGRAQNLDPTSDTNISQIGKKTKRESASGYATARQCMDLAEWRLKRSSVLQKAVSISCSQMMHIDLNSLVEIVRTDKPGSPTERHLVQGFTRPLAGNGAMTISATSVNDFVTATVTEWPPKS